MTLLMMSGNRADRTSPRYPVKLSVDVQGYAHAGRMETSDVSRVGIFIKTDQPASVDTLLELKIYPISSSLGGEIVLTGEVVRVLRAAGPGQEVGMGLRVFPVTGRDDTRWGSLIDALIRQADSADTLPVVIPHTISDLPDQLREPVLSEGPSQVAAGRVETVESPRPPMSQDAAEKISTSTSDLDDTLPVVPSTKAPIRFPIERVTPLGTVPLTAMPRLRMSSEEMHRSGLLDQQRAFLLLYVDGHTSVEDIIELAHFDPQDTKAMLISLVRDGILEW